MLGVAFIAAFFVWMWDNIVEYFQEIKENFKEGYYGEESSR